MTFNKASEEKEWWKLKEEELLRTHGVPEYIVEELQKYDWSMFNSERRFLQRQFTTSEIINIVGDYEIQISIEDIHSL